MEYPVWPGGVPGKRPGRLKAIDRLMHGETVTKRVWGVVILCLLAMTVDIALGAPTLALNTRRQVFMQVWTRVRDNFYDPKLNGVNWEAVRRRYAPRVDRADSDAAFYGALNEMLGELKASHFAVLPPSAYVPEAAGNGKSEDGETGMTTQLVEGQAVITEIEPDSPAAKSGLKPGYAITHIDGKPVETLLARIRARKLRPGLERLYVMFGLAHSLNGAVDSTVKVRALDGSDHALEVTLARRKPEGELVHFAELPPLYAHVEAKRLQGGIGYIRFNIFLLPVLEPIKQAIRDMHSAPGIIIDLRGNPGGVGAMASSIADELYSKRDTLGTMKLRQGEFRFAVFPVSDPYRGPVLILMNEGSVSSSEVLAGSLQESRRAHVVGRISPGMVLPSQFEPLPGGARLQIAIADFRTPKGVLLEGRGVQPDIPVELTRRALLNGPDPTLEAAVDYISKQPAQQAEERKATKEN